MTIAIYIAQEVPSTIGHGTNIFVRTKKEKTCGNHHSTIEFDKLLYSYHKVVTADWSDKTRENL